VTANGPHIANDDAPQSDGASGGAVPASPLAGIEEGTRADEDRIDAFASVDLECLAELRGIGMAIAEGLGRYVAGTLLPSEEKVFKGCDVALAFSRVARAVRQIIVLEQEVMGLREKHWLKEKPRRTELAEPLHESVERADRPERERFRDYDDYDDYLKGTPEEIIAQVRAELMSLPGAALVMAGRASEPARSAAADKTAGELLLAERPLEHPLDRTRPKTGHDPP